MADQKNNSKKSLTKLSFQDADKVKGGATSLSSERLKKEMRRKRETQIKHHAQTTK